jgi:hypothetical protein
VRSASTVTVPFQMTCFMTCSVPALTRFGPAGGSGGLSGALAQVLEPVGDLHLACCGAWLVSFPPCSHRPLESLTLTGR